MKAILTTIVRRITLFRPYDKTKKMGYILEAEILAEAKAYKWTCGPRPPTRTPGLNGPGVTFFVIEAFDGRSGNRSYGADRRRRTGAVKDPTLCGSLPLLSSSL